MRVGRVALVAMLVAFGCAPAHRNLLHDTVASPYASLPPAPPAVAPHATPPAPPVALGCEQHPSIDVWEEKLRSHHQLRVTTDESLERAERLLPELRRLLEEDGLPPSLALLPAVESSFRTHARAPSGGSAGLWQLRGPTARRFGLTVNRRRDDRLHAARATRAAARYLRYLHDRYGDWPLTLAAYNAGEGRVDRARARQPEASFWELAATGGLPRISADYVPRFLALVRIADDERACGRDDAARRADLVIQ